MYSLLTFQQVERALRMWKDGVITCKSANSKNPIIRRIDPATGKPSAKLTEFNQASWGIKTGDYLTGIQANIKTTEQYERLVELATPFILNRRNAKAPTDDDLESRKRARVGDDSDFSATSEEEELGSVEGESSAVERELSDAREPDDIGEKGLSSADEDQD